MAYTVTRYASVFGNKRAVGLKVTADAATQTVQTGLGVIEWYSIGYGSMSSNGIKVAINSNASGVAEFGSVGVTGCTTGDDFYLTVYGR